MPPLTLFGLPPSLTPSREAELGKAFVKRLGEEIGLPMEPRIASGYSELSDELAEGRLDFAWLPPLEASRLSDHCGIIRLAQALRAGQSHYHSVLFTRDDSALQSLTDLEGKQVAFVHRRSASGFVVVMPLLRRAGISTAEPPLFMGSHAEVIRAVMERRADAGATFCTFDGDPDKGKVVASGWTQAFDASSTPMRIIAVAGEVPSDTICAWPGTSLSLRQQLVKALLDLSASKDGQHLIKDLFGAEGFAPADSASA